jgi:IS605 OrfB family transposase
MTADEHAFDTAVMTSESRLVHRTARIRVRVTQRQADRCYGLLRSAGDVWAWLLNTNHERLRQGLTPVTSYQALCRELTVVVAGDAGLLISGRAIRSENYLHLREQQARRHKAARRSPTPGQRGSRRWRRFRYRLRQAEARHRRRVHQAHHRASKQVVAFALQHRIGTLVVGHPRGITARDVGRTQHLRLRQWRRTHLLRVLYDKAERAGIQVRLVDERGSSSTCPACRGRVAKPSGRRFCCPHCGFQGHRDLVGAHNIAAKVGGGATSAVLPAFVEHRRAGIVPERRDRRRHLYDQRRRSCLASGHPLPIHGARGVARRMQSPTLHLARITPPGSMWASLA